MLGGIDASSRAPDSRKEVIHMVEGVTRLIVCAHELERITRAVAAYKPAKEERVDYQDLFNWLSHKCEENPIPPVIDPEDIPF
jgi:hypothetical protein